MGLLHFVVAVKKVSGLASSYFRHRRRLIISPFLSLLSGKTNQMTNDGKRRASQPAAYTQYDEDGTGTVK